VNISIANIRDLPLPSEWPEWYVYVGRPAPRRGLRGSSLANPYRIGQLSTDGHMRPLTREMTIYWYNNWLRLSDPVPKLLDLILLRSLLRKHGKLVLVCWCAPRPCHAEIIREVLEAGDKSEIGRLVIEADAEATP